MTGRPMDERELVGEGGWPARWGPGQPELTREELLELLLRTCYRVWLNDKTRYEHHGRRLRDGAMPYDDGGTRWLEPKEIAYAVLKRFGVDAHEVFLGRAPVPGITQRRNP